MARVISKEFTGSLPVGNGPVVFYTSVNTPDFPEELWHINPDISSVSSLDIKYWKIIDDNILAMTPEEKLLVDGYLQQSAPTTDLLLINYAESTGVSSTTSTTAQPKISLTTEGLTLGSRYEIYWYCELGASRRNEAFMNITINDVEVARGEKSIYRFNSDDVTYESVSGFFSSSNLDNLTIIKLNFGDLNYGGSSVYIRNAKLGIKKGLTWLNLQNTNIL